MFPFSAVTLTSINVSSASVSILDLITDLACASPISSVASSLIDFTSIAILVLSVGINASYVFVVSS